MTAIPNIYRPPLGLPLAWQDEQSGALPAAVRAYYAAVTNTGPEITREQLALLVDYCRHYINAPCWRDDGSGTLAALRQRIRGLNAVPALTEWLIDALDFNLEPL